MENKKIEVYYTLKGKESRGKLVKFNDLGDAHDLANILEESGKLVLLEIFVNEKLMKQRVWE